MKFLIILLMTITFIYSEETAESISWKNLKVSVRTKEIPPKTSSGFPETLEELIFLDKKTGKNVNTTDQFLYRDSRISKLGIFQNENEEFLYVISKMYIEGGSDVHVTLYNYKNNKIKSFASLNAFNVEFINTDLNKDKKEELIKKYNDSYFGFNLKGKSCSLNTPLLIYPFGQVAFPEIYILKKIKNNYKFKNVTFQEEYADSLKSYFTKAEDFLKENKGKSLSLLESTEISGLISYYTYMLRLGKAKQAMENIKDSEIQINFYCTNPVNEDLHSIIKSNKKSILKKMKEHLTNG